MDPKAAPPVVRRSPRTLKQTGKIPAAKAGKTSEAQRVQPSQPPQGQSQSAGAASLAVEQAPSVLHTDSQTDVASASAKVPDAGTLQLDWDVMAVSMCTTASLVPVDQDCRVFLACATCCDVPLSS